jgi:hypothetical protein
VTLDEAGVRELWMVANAVRHDDGRSLRILIKTAPRLWEHTSPANDGVAPMVVSNMRLQDADLQRYTLAVMKFWHAAGASPL